MRQDIAFLVITVALLSALGAFVYHYYGASEDGFDEFASPGDAMAQYSCGGGDAITSRDFHGTTMNLATSMKANGLRSNSRTDLISWRTKRNRALRKRAGASDFAQFDALRPAYDAMCRSMESAQTGDCFRNLAPLTSGEKVPSWATAVRKQVHIWAPSTSAFMQRPTLMCISMVTDPERVEMAFVQFKLWGKNCDDFFIGVELPTADQTVVHNHTTDTLKLRAQHKKLLQSYGFPADHLWAVRPLVSWKIEDPVRYDRWQAFRELSRVMGDEELTHPVFNAEYMLFVREDTYVIPENVFGFLSSPEVRHFEHISAPVMLGHVLQVPPPIPGAGAGAAGGEEEEAQIHDNKQHQDQQQNKDKPAPAKKFSLTGGPSSADPFYHRRLFASFDGGVIWNRLARKLFMNAVRSQDTCAYANTEADDVMLADCFRYYGLNPIDTADTRGSDRQHILRPEWAMTVGSDPKLVEWYSLFRGRPSLPGAAAISETSMTFGGLNSIEEMEELHRYLS